ncbi:MAG: transcriptional regulator [Bacilli bacterium]|nr:transcriptional regulator [Bacilli bacterium]
MEDKYISTQSGKLLNYFNKRDISCFRYDEAYKALPDVKQGTVKQLLSDMTDRGLLMRLKTGVYYIIPYEADSSSFMPDWHLIAPFIVNDAEYYIGYYSALQIHNLITQPSLKEQIVVSKQITPSVLMIKDIPFQFIYHNKDHFFGYKKTWIDSFNKVNCSDLEKTIVDCLYRPDYGGGITEIAKAIYQTKDKLNFETLEKYVLKFKSPAVIKRLGFLLETLNIENDIIDTLQKHKKSSYVLLDPQLPAEGNYLDRWKIQVNIDIETIKSAIYT